MARGRKQRERWPEESPRGQWVRLRPIGAEDLPRLAAWDEDPEVTALTGKKFGGAGGSPQEWYRRTRSGGRIRALGIEVRGDLIGEIEVDQIDWRLGTGELRILIGEKEHWGRGYGTDALRTLLRMAFGSWGLRTVYLRVYQENHRAVRLYRRCGFTPQGVLAPSRRRGDRGPVLLMELTRERFWQYLREAVGTA